MGPFIIVIILVSGYIVTRSFLPLRYRIVRESGYHIYLRSGLAGFIVFIISFLSFVIIDLYDLPSLLMNTLNIAISDIPHFYLMEDEGYKWGLLLMLCILISALLHLSFNIYYRKPSRRFKTLIKIVNPMERILFDACANAYPICITLDSNKVYVGLLETVPPVDDGRIEYLRMLPLLSGFRDQNSLTINFTTNYYEHYRDGELDKSSEWLTLDLFSIVIPEREVVSISNFDIDVYKKFLSQGYTNSNGIYSPADTYNQPPSSFTPTQDSPVAAAPHS